MQDRAVNVITEEMSVLWEHTVGGPEWKDSCWGFLGKRDDQQSEEGEQELAEREIRVENSAAERAQQT